MTIQEWLKIKCAICGRLHGECYPEIHPAWKIWDGCYTHEIPSDTPLTVTFKAIIPPNLRMRVIKAEHAQS